MSTRNYLLYYTYLCLFFSSFESLISDPIYTPMQFSRDTTQAYTYFREGIASADDKQNYSAIASYRQAQKILQKVLDQPILPQDQKYLYEIHMKCYARISACFYAEENTDSFFYVLNTWEKVALQHLPPNHETFITLYNNYGAYFNTQLKYEQAISYFSKAIKVSVQQNNKDTFAICAAYKNIGTLHKSKDDFYNAKRYYQKSITYGLSDKDKYDIELTNAYNSLALLHKKLKQYIEADRFSKIAMKVIEPYYDKSLGHKQKYLVALITLAGTYKENQNYQEALKQYHQAIIISKSLNNYKLHYIYHNIGGCYLDHQNYQAALDTFQLALNLRQKKYQRNPTYLKNAIRVATTINKIGEIYYYQNQPKVALVEYQKALQLLIPDFTPSDPYTNPKLSSPILSRKRLLTTLKYKAQALFKLYQQTQTTSVLEHALSTYQLLDELIATMRQSFAVEESKLVLADQTIPIYEQAIQTAFTLYKVTKNTEYQYQAFYFAEKGKALALLEAVKDLDAKDIAEVPDGLLIEERELKRRLLLSQKAWNEAIKKGKETSILKDARFNAEQNLQDFQANMKGKYPKYYQLKYDATPPTIELIRQELLVRPSTALVAYFVGEQQIYVFTITQKDLHIHQIAKPTEFAQQIKQLRNTWQQNPKALPVAQTLRVAHHFYQQYLQPALPQDTAIHHLILIPDDQLYYLSFDALVTKLPSPLSDYWHKNIAYLIKQYQLSYAYSTALLLTHQRMNKETPISQQKKFGGFAPKFKPSNCSHGYVDDLPSIETEVKQIVNIIDGELHLGKQATKQDFEKTASQYSILHLATHACADETDHLKSHIHFFNDNIIVPEIYNLPLHTVLAVLSACETGTGQLKRGEGVMSLARAFFYAGCPSVVTSLWKADDKAMEQIMVLFYKYLHAGYDKATALQQAKLGYLNYIDRANTHPYYWATCSVVGDIRPIFPESIDKTVDATKILEDIGKVDDKGKKQPSKMGSFLFWLVITTTILFIVRYKWSKK